MQQYNGFIRWLIVSISENLRIDISWEGDEGVTWGGVFRKMWFECTWLLDFVSLSSQRFPNEFIIIVNATICWGNCSISLYHSTTDVNHWLTFFFVKNVNILWPYRSRQPHSLCLCYAMLYFNCANCQHLFYSTLLPTIFAIVILVVVD